MTNSDKSSIPLLSRQDAELLLRQIDHFSEKQLKQLFVQLTEAETQIRKNTAKSSLLDFAQYMRPEFMIGPPHKLLAEKLEALECGDITRLAVSMPPRMGKLLADSTAVPTPCGWKKHGDLKCGDMVFGLNGAPIEVLAVSSVSEANYLVELTNGEQVLCHGAHEWTLSHNSSNYKVYETRDLAQLKLTTSNKHGNGPLRYVYSLPITKALQQPEKTLPLDPYIMGVWLGDGTKSTSRICGGSHDIEHIEKEFRRRGFVWRHRYEHSMTGVVSYDYGSDTPGKKSTLATGLYTAGVYKRKHIPTEYLRASQSQRLALLAGIIDTDGCVTKETGRVTISGVVGPLMEGVAELIRTFGWRVSYTVSPPRTSTSGVVGKQAIVQIGFNPTFGIPTQIPRKQISRFAKQKRIMIKTVTKMQKGELGRCIQVNAADGLYLVGKTMQPTHNSWLCSQLFPAWYLGKHPKEYVLGASHSTQLAEDNIGRPIRDLIQLDRYQELFPDTIVRSDTSGAGRWATTQGGTGYFVGVGASIAGRGAHLFCCDDPHSEADLQENFEALYEKVWTWYQAGPLQRLMPNGKILIIHTRWSKRDLIGRVLDNMAKNDDAERWEYLELPAILPATGQSIWPDMWPTETLLRKKATMFTHLWAAQYMQQPVNAESAIVKKEWIKRWTKKDPPRCEFIIMSCDTAMEATNRSDYNSIGVYGIFQPEEGGNFHIILLDDIHKRLEFPELKKLVVETYKEWRVDSLVIERKNSGASLIQELQRTGVSALSFNPGHKDKIARLNSVVDIIAEGKFWVPEGYRWAEEFIEEVVGFPGEMHDDRVDQLVMALDRFRKGGFISLDSDWQVDMDIDEAPQKTRGLYWS